MVPFPIILNEPHFGRGCGVSEKVVRKSLTPHRHYNFFQKVWCSCVFKVTPFFDAEYLTNGYRYGHSCE